LGVWFSRSHSFVEAATRRSETGLGLFGILGKGPDHSCSLKGQRSWGKEVWEGEGNANPRPSLATLTDGREVRRGKGQGTDKSAIKIKGRRGAWPGVQTSSTLEHLLRRRKPLEKWRRTVQCISKGRKGKKKKIKVRMQKNCIKRSLESTSGPPRRSPLFPTKKKQKK